MYKICVNLSFNQCSQLGNRPLHIYNKNDPSKAARKCVFLKTTNESVI